LFVPDEKRREWCGTGGGEKKRLRGLVGLVAL